MNLFLQILDLNCIVKNVSVFWLTDMLKGCARFVNMRVLVGISAMDGWFFESLFFIIILFYFIY